MPGFGRIPAPDPRDHRLRAFLPTVPAPPRRSPWPMFRTPLDQGQEGTCVGHGWKHWMLTAPIIQTTPQKAPTALDLYDRATYVDEWDGNEGDRQSGTSVRAGAKACQHFGVLMGYAFTDAAEEATAWLDAHGPVVIGVDWLDGMFDADREGIIRATGPVLGGHCVCLDWHDAKRGLVAGPNSWGAGWGKRGRFKLPLEDFAALLARGGEVCSAAEVRRFG